MLLEGSSLLCYQRWALWYIWCLNDLEIRDQAATVVIIFTRLRSDSLYLAETSNQLSSVTEGEEESQKKKKLTYQTEDL